MDEKTPSNNPLDAMRRFWWLLVLTVLIGAGLGFAYGHQRDPAYTAEARLSVGRVDVPTQAIAGFQTAAQTLAGTYSRAIVARNVVVPVAKKVDLSPDEVTQHLGATPIPESGIVRVLGVTHDSASAIRIANVGAKALVRYVHHLNEFNPQTRDLLTQYRKAVAALVAAQHLTPSKDLTQDQITAKIYQARLKVNSTSALYGQSQQGTAAPNTLQVLALAIDSTSDRTAIIERAAFAGAVGGLVVGVLLATAFQALGNRRRRRRQR